MKGILRSEILRVKADFAAMSAFSLPLIRYSISNGTALLTRWCVLPPSSS